MTKIKINKDIFICFTFMFYLAVMDVFIKYIAGLDLFKQYSVAFNLCFISLMGAFTALFNTKGKYIFTSCVGALIAVYGFSQAMHFQVFNTFYSIAKIEMLPQLMQVSNGAATSVDFFSLQMWIPFIVLMIINSLVYFKFGYVVQHKRKHLKIIYLSILLMMSVGCGFTVHSYPDYPQHVRSFEYLYERLYNKSMAVNYFGVYSFLFKDIYNSFIKRNKGELESIHNYQKSHGYQAVENEFTGIFKGKNLILVLAESVSKQGLDPRFTPFMCYMAENGISFQRHYAPLFDSNTADSELIALTGTMPSTEGSITPNHYFMNHYNTGLAHLFKRQGYNTLSFHSWFKEFYNRNITHTSYGFDHYYADDELEFNKFDGWTRAFNWPKDTELFSQVLNHSNLDAPFMNFIISATSHMPYRSDRNELQDAIEWLSSTGYSHDNTEVFVYNASLHELDLALKNLVSELEDKGLMDDTVIAVFGDHYPYGMSEQAQQEYFQDVFNTVDMYQTPFFIYAKNIKPVKISKITSTFDIYPTLANLFGLDINGEVLFGHDALSTNYEPMVYFSDYSWLNMHAYYNASTGEYTYYDDVLTQSMINEINNHVLEALSIGQDLLASDSFTYKDGKLINK